MSQPQIETRATKTEQGWQDKDGFVGPFAPGLGPRTDPRGEFPTGPEIGTAMPNVVCNTADDTPFDLHSVPGDQPIVFLFYRSAVW